MKSSTEASTDQLEFVLMGAQLKLTAMDAFSLRQAGKLTQVNGSSTLDRLLPMDENIDAKLIIDWNASK